MSKGYIIFTTFILSKIKKKSVAPVDGSFQLVSGFPARPLKNPNLTIEEADLIESLVTQKL